MPSIPFDRLPKLTLGTVQLGMPYGIAVPTHPPEQTQALQILDTAWHSGITCFDTARAYGDSEKTLARWCATSLATDVNPLIVSKFPPVTGDDPPMAVRLAAGSSREALGQRAIDAYLAHRATDILLPGVADALRALRDDGWIQAFGVSVYDPEELERVLTVPDLSVVQLPASLLDQRFHDSGLLDRCAERGIVVFARSVFLQGVMFLSEGCLPDFLQPAAEPIRAIRRLAGEVGCPIASMAVAGVLSMPGISSVVIGIADRAQLVDNVRALGALPGPEIARQAQKLCRSLPAPVIDPRQWR